MNTRYDWITRSRGITPFALPCTDSASSAASISGAERARSRRYLSSTHVMRAAPRSSRSAVSIEARFVASPDLPRRFQALLKGGGVALHCRQPPAAAGRADVARRASGPPATRERLRASRCGFAVRIAAYGAAASSPYAILATSGSGILETRVATSATRSRQLLARSCPRRAFPPQACAASPPDRCRSHRGRPSRATDRSRRAAAASPLGSRGVRRGSGARISAFDRACRRPVATDDFDDTEPTRIGGRDRQHRLLRGSQFAVPWSAGPHPDRWGRRAAAAAHAQQRHGEPSPCRAPPPARRRACDSRSSLHGYFFVLANHASTATFAFCSPWLAASSRIRRRICTRSSWNLCC